MFPALTTITILYDGEDGLLFAVFLNDSKCTQISNPAYEVVQLNIRRYQSADALFLSKLFYDTVHTVNAKDYSPAQLDAWATGNVDLVSWDKSLLEHNALVATVETEGEETIIGFGDIDDSGFLHRLYIHKDHQKKGVATALCEALEKRVEGDRVTVHASITAKPFFEKRGYKVIREQQVERSGVLLTNYVMEKRSDVSKTEHLNKG